MNMPKLVGQLQEDEDGRWIAEVLGIPGAPVYGSTREEAIERAQVLMLRVLADRLERGEPIPELSGLFDAA
jgi:predicted RNase H-like HicB family nuclease